MNELDLHDVMDRATDAIEPRDLARSSWERAGARRMRRRSVRVAAGAALATVVVVAFVQLVDRDRAAPHPAPAPSPSATVGDVLTPEDVRDPLGVSADLPLERSLNLPANLTPQPPWAEVGGGTVAAVQTADGEIALVGADGAWRRVTKAGGRVFRHSLTLDGGAIALRTQQGFTVYSMYSDRAFDYPVAETGESGLWLLDGVGFAYDVSGPGGETREHEFDHRTDTVAFPEGDDLDDVAIDGRSQLHEFGGGSYLRWTDFQQLGDRLDMRNLGDLRGPSAGYRDADILAVVRSGLDSERAVDADGILVLDTEGTPRTLLPVEGVPIKQVQVHHWVDVRRLLIEVGDELVLWDVVSDERTHVATIPAGATVAISDGDGSLEKR